MYSKKTLEKILHDVYAKNLTPDKAYEKLKNLPYENLSFARLDYHRGIRKNIPEAVYAPGKSFEQLTKIIRALKKSGEPVIVTRLMQKDFRRLKKKFPFLLYSQDGKIAYWKGKGVRNGLSRTVAVVTAGTGDIPVAEEAAVTLEIMGQTVSRVYDCGVAGIHRLVDLLDQIKDACAIICVAGMEGALASVMAGLVDIPVIAVPTSIGYGSSFKGIAPLLTMLNSCSPGVSVVNIDNGYGAACFAFLVAQQTK